MDGEGGDRPGTHGHGSEKETGTGTRHSDSGQESVRGGYGGSRSGGSTDGWDMGRDTSGIWGFWRWRLWPMMREFFDPKFEDPGAFGFGSAIIMLVLKLGD